MIPKWSLNTREMKIGVYLLVGWLTVYTHAASATELRECRAVLESAQSAEPDPSAAHLALAFQPTKRVDSGPVIEQCGGTCRYESLLSHLQSQNHIELSSDYLNVKRMQRTTAYMLDALERRGPNAFGEIPVASHGLPNIVDPSTTAESGDSFWDTVFKVKRVSGLAPASKFKFTPEFLNGMAQFAQIIGAVSKTGRPLSPIQLLDLKIGWMINNFKTEISAGADPKTLALIYRKKVSDVYDQALAGLQTGFDTEAFTERTLSSSNVQTIRPISAWTKNWSKKSNGGGRAAAERLIKAQIDKGENAVLYFEIDPFLINRQTGVARLHGSLTHELRKLKGSGGVLKSGHAVVVDGYTLNKSGSVEWLLIKDSQGVGLYDKGYMHMHIDYFRAYVLSVNALIEEKPRGI